jgi:Spy/CpxP family protein refolding chaperone
MESSRRLLRPGSSGMERVFRPDLEDVQPRGAGPASGGPRPPSEAPHQPSLAGSSRCVAGSLAFVLGMVILAAPALAQPPAQPPAHQPAGRPERTTAQEQPPSRKWWQNPRAGELGLTSEQSRRIEEIFQATLPTLKTCNSELERRESRLNAMVSASGVTEVEVSRQIDQVEASRSEMSKERTLMLFRMYQVLTPEQRERVKAMYEQWERDRRRPPEPRK